MRLNKRSLLKLAFSAPFFFSLNRALSKANCSILMFHRFEDTRSGHRGHSLKNLESNLAFLRKKKVKIISLTEVVKRLSERQSLEGSVALTIDDGYEDIHTSAAPIFNKYDCPVTVFLSTGFIDKDIWFWWDKIEYIIEETRLNLINLKNHASDFELNTKTSEDKYKSRKALLKICKNISDKEKHLFIEELARASKISIPKSIPNKYKPMTWEQIRELEKNSFSFGPHTRSHPILSKVSDQESLEEISSSWKRLTEELSKPCPVFCYPNGTKNDFGSREIENCMSLNLKAAVSTEAGYVNPSDIDNIFKLKRFSYPEELVDFAQIVSGFESLKSKFL